MNRAMLTCNAIRQMHFAMPADTWEVRCVAEGKERVIRQRYTWQQLINPGTSAFFRAKNLEGYNIFGRPYDTRFVLVDDISTNSLADLIADDLQAAAVLQTSAPGGIPNLQAWIVLSHAVLDEQIAAGAARLLAVRYDGDVGASGAYQLGRLPGLRNKKSKHHDAFGGAPLVTFAAKPRSTLIVPTGAEILLKEIAKNHNGLDRPASTLGGCDHGPRSSAVEMTCDVAAAIYRDERERLANSFSWGAEVLVNRSRVDHAIAKRLHHLGFESDEIEAVLMAGSEKAKVRGANYARATVRAGEGRGSK